MVLQGATSRRVSYGNAKIGFVRYDYERDDYIDMDALD